ncbi:MAG: hydrogenase maturation protease [Candidatus Asgardarchaeia archaeon]
MIRKEIIEKIKNAIVPGRTIYIGLGNPYRGDDAIGLYIAQKLKTTLKDRVYDESDDLDTLVLNLFNNMEDIEAVIFIDAVDAQLQPCNVDIFSISDISSFSFSTHKFPLDIYGALIESRGKHVSILGIQPRQLEFNNEITQCLKNLAEQVIGIISKCENSQ